MKLNEITVIPFSQDELQIIYNSIPKEPGAEIRCDGGLIIQRWVTADEDNPSIVNKCKGSIGKVETGGFIAINNNLYSSPESQEASYGKHIYRTLEQALVMFNANVNL